MSNQHDSKKRDNLQNVPADRQCGAKTRSRRPCKNWGLRHNGRCRMHGGKSKGGDYSPSFKHGWYSQYFPYNYRRSRVQYQMELERLINLGLRKLDIERQAREGPAAVKAEEDRKMLEQLDLSVLSDFTDGVNTSS